MRPKNMTDKEIVKVESDDPLVLELQRRLQGYGEPLRLATMKQIKNSLISAERAIDSASFEINCAFEGLEDEREE